MKKPATLSFAIGFVLLFVIMIVIFIAATPFLVNINSAFYDSGNIILDVGSDYADDITTVSVRDNMQSIFSDTKDNFEIGEATLGTFVQYFWMFAIIITAFVVAVLAKRAESMQRGLI